MSRESQQITLVLQSCKAGNAAAQKRLYELFYSYGMSVALRFTASRYEAQEVLNDAFYKVFIKLDMYDKSFAFKPWFRKIIVHTAIDYQRKYNKVKFDREDISTYENKQFSMNDGWDHLNYEDVIKFIQELSPAYQLVFNLYAIEGYKHYEIAEKLGISVGASKSNFARAKKKLQQKLSSASKVDKKGWKYGQ